ncbi:MAG TPA: SAM-dependent chlorinase/fluorinase [Bacteroidota bacterium]|nr:SAM-dependent chlorinase/fluorinase [Bacteroidota bacterium]
MPQHRNTSRVIALLTDFGVNDEYSGVIKGVILSIAPLATIVDITHNVDPQNIEEAGYLLWAAYRHFPEGSVFVSIVDPGVGTRRRILAVQAGGRIFVAPDNGILDFVLSEEKVRAAVQLRTEGAFAHKEVSHTFHGRDIFAPAAAWLAAGIPLSKLGVRRTISPVHSPFVDSFEEGDAGTVLHVDRFGNIITNFRRKKTAEGNGVLLGGRKVKRWIRNYEEAPGTEPCLIVGGTGLVEIVVRGDSASRVLGIRKGSALRVIGG